MSESDDGHHHHHRPPVTGEEGELVDLFMQVIDRETSSDPHWWYNYGQLTLLNFDRGLFTDDMPKSVAMGALREVLIEAVAAGVAEDFLIKSLKRELDEYMRCRSDPSNFNQRVDRMRAWMQGVINDPATRDGYRRIRAKRDSEYAAKTDGELIAEAKGTLDDSVTTRYVSAEDAGHRWADAEEWWAITGELLPDVIFEHWAGLKNQPD